MRLFLFATALMLVVLGCSDGKLNLLLVFWGDREEEDSSVEKIPNDPKYSSSIAKPSSSSKEMPPYSSGEEPPPLSSGEEPPAQSSSSRGARSSSAKTDDFGNTYIDYPALEEGAQDVKLGWATRYWDGCKPSCSWYENIHDRPPWATSWTICKNCDKENNEMPTWFEHPNTDQWWQGYLGTASSCDPNNMDYWVKSSTYKNWQAANPTYPLSPAYTCWDMAPVAINDTLAYGFAAMNPEIAECGTCYQLEFDGNWYDEPERPRPTNRAIKGKTMIVMASNIGGDVMYNVTMKNGKIGTQFDIMIPGGGVGAFNSFSNQIGFTGDMGATFGGLLTRCEDTRLLDMGIRDGAWRATLEQWQDCLRTECNRVFGGKPKIKQLLDGCLWHADWYMAANNPTLIYKKVQCPQYLIDKYKSKIDLEPPPVKVW